MAGGCVLQTHPVCVTDTQIRIRHHGDTGDTAAAEENEMMRML